MKRVAIPVTNNRLSEFFGECSHYEIFEIEKGIPAKRKLEIPAGTTAIDLPGLLRKQGVTDVIAHKINRNIISLFAAGKINLFVGVAVDSPQNLIDHYLLGRLESNGKIIAEITKNNND